MRERENDAKMFFSTAEKPNHPSRRAPNDPISPKSVYLIDPFFFSPKTTP